MTAPNSTELQDRLTRVLETFQAAREASDRRDFLLRTVRHDDPELHAAKRDATAAWGTAGLAEEDMRDAIRAAATVLDHAHVCDKPTPAGLLRENTSLRDQVAALREQVETLGGNAQPAQVQRPGKWLPGDQIVDSDGDTWTRQDDGTWTWEDTRDGYQGKTTWDDDVIANELDTYPAARVVPRSIQTEQQAV